MYAFVLERDINTETKSKKKTTNETNTETKEKAIGLRVRSKFFTLISR